MRFHQVRPREFLTVLFGLVAWPLPARARSQKVARIGFWVRSPRVTSGSISMRSGRARDLGYAEGRIS
jgi:hypothetical protein